MSFDDSIGLITRATDDLESPDRLFLLALAAGHALAQVTAAQRSTARDTNVDTKLFIDPLLLEKSRHPEINTGARFTFKRCFSVIIKLLRAAKAPGDVAWRNAQRQLSFPEVKGTCLGSGAQSLSGSGSGTEMTEHVIGTAKEIVDLGVEDPDLFVAMALFEERFGPDRISDMTTNVILPDLLNFNRRILGSLSIPRQAFTLHLRNGRAYDALLPCNPYVKGGAPIILVRGHRRGANGRKGTGSAIAKK